MNYDRIILLVLDGCGVGVQPDYLKYHSRKTNTLGNLYKDTPSFKLPFLESLGLSQILSLGRDSNSAIFGTMEETSSGNDTFAGVWEMMGVPFTIRFMSGHKGLGKTMLTKIQKESGITTVCNRYMSGYLVLDAYYE